MRIMYVSPEKLTANRPPAIQTLHTIRELCQVHQQVEFVTPWSERVVRLRSRELTGHSLPDSLRIVSVGPGPDLPLLSRIWPSQVWSGLSKRLLAYVRCALSDETPTVVYTRHRRTAALLARPDCPPLVFEYHEPESIVIGQRLGSGPVVQRVRAEELAGVKNSAALVTVGQAHARQARELYDYNGPVRVIRNGADPVQFGVPAGQRRIHVGRFLYIGSLDSWKGLPLALEAVSMVPQAQLHICGGSPQDPQWRKLATLGRQLNLGDRLHMHGHVPHSEVMSHLSRAHAGLLPIDGRQEIAEKYTCPLKLMEYMTAGLPTIASDLSSVREIVEHNRQALLFPTNDATQLAHAMQILIESPDLTARLSRNALQTAAQYSWRRRAERILDLCCAVRNSLGPRTGNDARSGVRREPSIDIEEKVATVS